MPDKPTKKARVVSDNLISTRFWSLSEIRPYCEGCKEEFASERLTYETRRRTIELVDSNSPKLPEPKNKEEKGAKRGSHLTQIFLRVQEKFNCDCGEAYSVFIGGEEPKLGESPNTRVLFTGNYIPIENNPLERFFLPYGSEDNVFLETETKRLLRLVKLDRAKVK